MDSDKKNNKIAKKPKKDSKKQKQEKINKKTEKVNKKTEKVNKKYPTEPNYIPNNVFIDNSSLMFKNNTPRKWSGYGDDKISIYTLKSGDNSRIYVKSQQFKSVSK